jgi:hypothetical protein
MSTENKKPFVFICHSHDKSNNDFMDAIETLKKD